MKTLLFVYNADADLFSQITDFTHKIFSPQNYACNLCAITFSNLGMKQEWRTFLETLAVEKKFLHRDEFHAKYPREKATPLPAIFIESEEGIKSFLTAAEINQKKDVASLKTAICEKLR